MGETARLATGAPSRRATAWRIPQPARRALARALATWLMALFGLLVRVLPMRWCQGLADVVGVVTAFFARRRRALVDANLRAAFPGRYSPAERRQVYMDVARNAARVYVELLKLRHLPGAALREFCALSGGDRIRRALARGRGAMLVSAHFGNWEAMAARFAAEGLPLAVVSRAGPDRFSPPAIDRSRRALGVEPLSRQDVRGMLTHLRHNGCLGILADQRALTASIPVDFLGRQVYAPRGPAVLALRTGCAVLPVFCARRADGTLEVRVLDEIEVPSGLSREDAVVDLTQRINSAIGDEVRRAPEQWLWFHNRWRPVRRPRPDTGP